MEVEIKYNTVSDYERQIFQEILPFFDANDGPTDIACHIDFDAKDSVNIIPDAVHAVKRDPAVIEVVTLDEPPATPREEYHQEEARGSTPGSSSPRSSSSSSSFTQTFEHLVCAQRDALLSLSPQQMELLLGYVDTLRRQRMAQQRSMECAFCKNNGEPESWYSSHALKDWRGRIRCPVLRSFRCPRCGATGDWAHTIKYCRENYNSDRRSNCSQDFAFF